MALTARALLEAIRAVDRAGGRGRRFRLSPHLMQSPSRSPSWSEPSCEATQAI
jgi:hypothetical protein